MNYLELVQESIRQSGAHLQIPTTLSGLDGLQLLFKNWIRDAWQDIQIERPQWFFRQDHTAVTIDPATLDKQVIVPPSEISAEMAQDWKLITLRDIYVHDPNDAEDVPAKIYYVSWSRWPEVFGRTESRLDYNLNEDTSRKPLWFTISPKGDVHVYPRPDKTYEMQFHAPKAIQVLETDTDEPFLEEHFRMAIVFKALMEYSLYHDDRTVFERARNKWRTYKKGMERRYTPDMNLIVHSLYRDIR